MSVVYINIVNTQRNVSVEYEWDSILPVTMTSVTNNSYLISRTAGRRLTGSLCRCRSCARPCSSALYRPRYPQTETRRRATRAARPLSDPLCPDPETEEEDEVHWRWCSTLHTANQSIRFLLQQQDTIVKIHLFRDVNARPGLKPVVLMKEDALLISPVGICFWCSCLYALAY